MHSFIFKREVIEVIAKTINSILFLSAFLSAIVYLFYEKHIIIIINILLVLLLAAFLVLQKVKAIHFLQVLSTILLFEINFFIARMTNKYIVIYYLLILLIDIALFLVEKNTSKAKLNEK